MKWKLFLISIRGLSLKTVNVLDEQLFPDVFGVFAYW